MALLPSTAPARIDPIVDRSADHEGRSDAAIDEAAIAAIIDLHREIFPSGGAILDLMSGWVGHLPPEIQYSRVVGVGADASVLAENPFLDEWREQDLNQDPRLDFAEGEFDGAALCASIQRLTRPCELIREVGRVLKPGAPLVVAFSRRCLPVPPIGCWCLHDDTSQLCLVAQHFAAAGNWSDIRCLDRTPPGGGDPVYAVIGRSLGAR
jgi:SAM-dependent methyltransferase